MRAFLCLTINPNKIRLKAHSATESCNPLSSHALYANRAYNRLRIALKGWFFGVSHVLVFCLEIAKINHILRIFFENQGLIEMLRYNITRWQKRDVITSHRSYPTPYFPDFLEITGQ